MFPDKVINSRSIILLVMALLTLFVGLSNAQAETIAKEPGPLQCSGDAYGNDKSCNCRSRYEGYLLAVIVPCIRDEVQNATKRMTNEFAPMLQGIITAFMTLVVVLFGIKVLLADGDPKKDGFILLVKIGAVAAFMGSYDELIIDPAFEIMKEGVDLTTGAFDITTQHCADYLTKYPNAMKPWSHYDCVLGNLMGFGPETFLGVSALGITGAALVSGQFGSIFVMGTVVALFFLIKLVLRGVYTYLMAVIGLGVLIFISPLLIPLIWMPSTQQYFDRWVGAFVAMIVMPAIVMGYLTLSFLILNHIVFDDKLGIATMLTKENVQGMQMGRECSRDTVVSNPDLVGLDKSQLEDDSQINVLYPIFSGSGDSNLFSCFYNLDFKGGEAGRVGTLFFGAIALLIVSYILMSMLDAVIQMSQIMLGGGFFMQQAISGNPFEQGLSNVQAGMQQNMAKAGAAADGAGAGGRAAAMAQGIGQGVANIPAGIVQAMTRR